MVQQEKKYDFARAIEDIVGVFDDPIIAFPGPWMADLSLPSLAWIKPRITMDRLLEEMTAHKEGRNPTATNSEVMVYMYPRIMDSPLGHEWTQIYLYASCRALKAEGRDVPDDIWVEKLGSDEERYLSDLKHFIYERRRQHRTETASSIRKEQKASEKQEALEAQPGFDLFGDEEA